METMVQAIGEFGLSIALVITFVFGFWKVYNFQREDNLRREEQNLETVTRLSGILSKNSEALLKNSEVMEKISEKVDNIDAKLENVQHDVTEIKARQSNRE